MNQTRLELEICVAACVLYKHGENILHVDIPTDDFIHLPSKAVIGAARESTPIDPLLVKVWASRNNINVGVADVTELLGALPTATNFSHYFTQLKFAIYKAEIDKLRNELRERSKSEDLLALFKEISNKESFLSSKYLEFNQSGDLTEACSELLARIDAGEDNQDLVPTNLDFLDELLAGGLLPNELIVIAARPSVGKTALALQMATEIGQKCAFFSLEMNKSKLSARLLASIARQNTKIAARKPSQISNEVKNRLLNSSAELIMTAEKLLVFDHHDQTMASIRRIARRAVEDGAVAIIIDYLQLITCEGETRQQAIAQVSRDCKNMAKELNVPVIVLSQLSRACESEKRPPRLSDLRESGAIEQDADIVVFLHDSGAKTEDGYRKTFALAAKGRDVGIGAKLTLFNHDHQRYYKLSSQEEPR